MTSGFGPLAIHTPQEMVHYEDENQDLCSTESFVF